MAIQKRSQQAAEFFFEMVNAIPQRPRRGAGPEERFLFPAIEEGRTGKSQPPRHGGGRMPIEEHLNCLLPELLGVNVTPLWLSIDAGLDHKNSPPSILENKELDCP